MLFTWFVFDDPFFVLRNYYVSFLGVCECEHRGQQGYATVGDHDDDRLCCYETGAFNFPPGLYYTQAR